ncbi:MAG: hypothetical protein QM770_23265 [Tepidisphaeraceae bacterium]
MAQAFVITLEKPLPDQAAMDAYLKTRPGKALFRESDRVSFAARKCNVPALTSMLSESAEKLIEQMRAEGFDPTKMRIPPEQWFAPSDALRTIAALIPHITANLNDFKQPNPILRELQAAETLLTAAAAAGIRFHFTNAVV